MIRLSWDPPPKDQLYDVVAAVAALGGAVGWLQVPPQAEVDAWLDEVLPRARFASAYDDDRLVACGYWTRLPAAVLDRNAEIRKVMTHPDARGRGAARLVTAALVQDARAAGVEVVTIDCRGNNHGALRLYASLGFVVTGRRPDFIAVGGDRFDQVLLHLDLRDGSEGLVRYGGRRAGPGVT